MTPRDEIARLIALYPQMLDDQDYDDWVKLFTVDGIIAFGGAEYRGHDEIKTAVAKVQPTAPGKHLVGYPVIDLLSDTSAHAFTDMITLNYGEQGKILTVGMSRYHDVLTVVDGKWRFAARYMTSPGAQPPPNSPPRAHA